ncbi:hypothetical protein [Haloplasma contractile]|uniref:Uncharacterized protein n=1 Tax=Haloplasma contractile SSD-17B TaxID=1033810 RepID=U2FFE5_9MOLU|nr:hypothetical protein [Haloplasma contractile]ERJ11640.1 hypothetical protein HLPCO_002341 [Haloplasma contractile SSD-17B]
MLNHKVIRIGSLAFLLVGLIVTSSSAFAYWKQVTISNDVEIVTIGEPVELIVTDLNSGSQSTQLVPSGHAMFVGDIEEVMLTYRVGVTRELLNNVNLIVTVTDVLIGGDATYSHLIDIDIMGSQEQVILDMHNDDLVVSVSVQLLEPIDKEEANQKGLDLSLVNVDDSKLAYDSIKGQKISFRLEFELQKKDTISSDI